MAAVSIPRVLILVSKCHSPWKGIQAPWRNSRRGRKAKMSLKQLVSEVRKWSKHDGHMTERFLEPAWLGWPSNWSIATKSGSDGVWSLTKIRIHEAILTAVNDSIKSMEQRRKPFFIVKKGPTNKCRWNDRIRNHHLAAITVVIDGIDVKTHGWVFDKKEDTCVFSKYLHQNYLLITKGRIVTSQWKELAAKRSKLTLSGWQTYIVW